MATAPTTLAPCGNCSDHTRPIWQVFSKTARRVYHLEEAPIFEYDLPTLKDLRGEMYADGTEAWEMLFLPTPEELAEEKKEKEREAAAAKKHEAAERFEEAKAAAKANREAAYVPPDGGTMYDLAQSMRHEKKDAEEEEEEEGED